MAANYCRIYIGNIDAQITEKQIRDEVNAYGVVTHFAFLSNGIDSDRGCAFVTYGTAEEAVKAISALNGKSIDGGSTKLEARYPNQGLVQKSPATMYPQVMASPVDAVIWQQFFTPEGHPYYYNTKTFQTQWERPPEMDMVQMQAQANRGTTTQSSFGPPGSNLFVFHLPPDWNDIDLVQHFQHFGNILSARIQREKDGRNRGFGFVSFDNLLSAHNAIRGMNGFCVGGKYLKVQLKKGEEQYAKAAGLVQPATTGVPVANTQAFMGMHTHNPSARYAPY